VDRIFRDIDQDKETSDAPVCCRAVRGDDELASFNCSLLDRTLMNKIARCMLQASNDALPYFVFSETAARTTKPVMILSAIFMKECTA